MYTKHDSFFALKLKKQKKINHIIDRINKTSKDTSIIEKLSLEHKILLKKAIQDLLDNSEPSSKIKFRLITVIYFVYIIFINFLFKFIKYI